MPQLLLEFFSEEIPARMQKRAEEDLARALSEKLKTAGFEAKAIRTFSSPRRIGAVIDDLPGKAADVNEEKKGPRVGAPEQAVQGFLKSAGLSSIAQAQIVQDKKGDFYVARIERAGRETGAILQEILPEIVRGFPWPKSMRSGSSDLQWVRPLQNILCLFAGAHVRIAIDGVPSEPVTWGHRFHAPDAIHPRDAADHAAKLRAAKVEIDREARKRTILEDAKKLCAGKGLELVDDIGLLEEVAGLVEWPRVILGDMDPAFLDLPAEVIRLSMRTHQKYFAVRDPKTKALAPHFITVANVEAKDGGKAIAAGNARVLSARLNDARFFWDTDRKTSLFTEERKAKLEKIVFHQKLGSVWGKVERVKALAVELCAVTGADAGLVARAAELCKMDLVTETVGEFPELQGQIGRQLHLASSSMEEAPRSGGGGARAGGERGASRGSSSSSRATPPQSALHADSSSIEEEQIARAIEDHYRPLGPNDRVPSDPVAVTLALADKLDTLVGFWRVGEKPTGSGDPFGLRRAGLGVIRILLENSLRANILYLLGAARRAHGESALEVARLTEFQVDLVRFVHERLRVALRDSGARHDLLDAVFGGDSGDLALIVKRLEALDAFLKTEDGGNLLAGYKRAANILAAEEKKGKGLSEADIAAGLDAKLFAEPAEKALYAALEAAIPTARAAVEREDFSGAMKALAPLRAPVDAFFEGVLVNAPEEQLRRNRLLLLSRLREALSAVADFSKIEG